MKYSIQQTLTNKPFSRHQFESCAPEKWLQTLPVVSSGPNSQVVKISLTPPNPDLHRVKTEALISLIGALGGDAKSIDISWKIHVIFRAIQIQSSVCWGWISSPFHYLTHKLFN